jgi:chemotaxis protein MotB
MIGDGRSREDGAEAQGDGQGAAVGLGLAGGWERLGPSLLVYRGRRQENAQAWLLTFTDLSALMLTFFVLLFSMSSIEVTQWQNLIDSLSPRLDRLQQVTVALPQSEKSAEEVERLPGTDLDYLAAVLKEQMAANEELAGVRVVQRRDRLVISVPGDLLFASGSAELGEAGGKAAFTLGGVLRNLRNVIEIAGHADPEVPKESHPSNWELSLLRAAVLSEMLTKVGYRGEILVRGYGHSRYEEVDPALDPAERMARARRVDIVVHAYAAEMR